MAKYDLICVGEIAFDAICAVKTEGEACSLLSHVSKSFGGRGANVVAHLGAFGLDVLLVAPIGRDFEAIGGNEYMKRRNLSMSGLIASKDHDTPMAFVFTKTNDATTYFYEGPLHAEFGAYKAHAVAVVKKSSADVLFCTSSTPELNRALLGLSLGHLRVFAPAHELEHYTAAQLRDCLGNTDIFFLNEVEADSLERKLGIKVSEIGSRFGVKLVVNTIGEKGSVLFFDGKEVAVPICRPKAVVDTTGAGDSYAAVFVATYLKRKDYVYAAKIASAMASYRIEVHGAQSEIPTPKMVLERAEQNYRDL
jgi:sugar/nucleoside kinase (ribokinase family)